jgi:hypothetical protein
VEELPVRLAFPDPNGVTDEGMKQLESSQRRRVRLTPQHSRDRSALAVASRDLCYWSARRATARVLPSCRSGTFSFCDDYRRGISPLSIGLIANRGNSDR